METNVTPESHAVGTRKIVDTHFHLWDLDKNYYPWLSDGDRRSLIKDYSSLRKNYLVADLLRDIGELNVVAGVHIQAEHDHTDVVRETRWLQRVADTPASHGFPQAIVADADFASPDIERIFEAHCAFPNTRGIRHALHRRLDAPERMIRYEIRPGIATFRCCENLACPSTCNCSPGRPSMPSGSLPTIPTS